MITDTVLDRFIIDISEYLSNTKRITNAYKSYIRELLDKVDYWMRHENPDEKTQKRYKDFKRLCEGITLE